MGNNRVNIPVFEKAPGGRLLPNPVFHRPSDYLHSRCIEYPFSASQLEDRDLKVLDVGTAKGARPWVDWLDQLSRGVHGVDYDLPDFPINHVTFISADVRNLPYRNNSFDVVFAVSVIEHIGLPDPQVSRERKPLMDKEGDLAAIKEIARILKPGGRLIMTVPFGKKAGLILKSQARSYDIRSIEKFEQILPLKERAIFEYGFEGEDSWNFKKKFKSNLARGFGWFFRRFMGINFHELGVVEWRETSPEQCSAKNVWHVDGVFCGVFQKKIKDKNDTF